MNQNAIPPCLRWSADPRERVNQARALPLKLFSQLHEALRSAEPPSPQLILEAWDKRLRLPAQENDSVTDEILSSWVKAYETAWHAKQEAGKATEITAVESYVRLCAALLIAPAKRVSIPIVTVDGHSEGRLQKLWLDVVDDQQGRILLHPQFEWTRKDFDADFLSSIETAWRLAGEGIASRLSVFWHITEFDGRPVISAQQSGTSASAAAYRAFWHVRRGLCLDEDVFVLASCAAGDGSIQDVGDLGVKISSIQQHRAPLEQEAPATIVIAATTTDRAPADDASISHAASWAEVKTVSTTDELSAVRSCTASAVIAYLKQLVQTLDETPWTRDGKVVRLSDVHIPPQVWKYEYVSSLDVREGADGAEQTWRPSDAGPTDVARQRRKVRVPWIAEFQRPQRQQPVVIVGGPGFGKTCLLRWTAHEMALEAIGAMDARAKTWREVRWPVVTDLAAWLGTAGQPLESLQQSALAFASLPERAPALWRQALTWVMKARLSDQAEHTYLFLDALDQVPATQLRLLRSRLGGLDSFARRLVLSTREAAITTHLPAMNTQRITILEAASLSPEDARALAAKWLDATLAARLEAHLRAQPAMSVVADSPLLLTLACGLIARNPKAELPETAAHLYRDLMQSLVRGEWRDGPKHAQYAPDALLARLRPMAWRLFSRSAGANRFSRDTLMRALNGNNAAAGAQAEADLNELCHLGFLEASGPVNGEPCFQFRHTTFLEFLAASYLALEIDAEGWLQAQAPHWHDDTGWQPVKISELLDANAFEPAWEPVIVFASGLMKEPAPLIGILADGKKDDLFRHRLHLLCKCFGSQSCEDQRRLMRSMTRVFAEIKRIAFRSTRHPGKHAFVGMRFALWGNWVKPLIRSPLAADCILDGMLALKGCCWTKDYHGYAEWKVVELLKENLIQGRMSAVSVEKIAALMDGDAEIWGLDAALLAWRLAGPDQRQSLECRFLDKLGSTEPPVQFGAAAALALSNNQEHAAHGVSLLIAYVASNYFVLGAERGDMWLVSKTLVSLLQRSFAPLVAPVLIAQLLLPKSEFAYAIADATLDSAKKAPTNMWVDCVLASMLTMEAENFEHYRRWAAEVAAKRTNSSMHNLGVSTLLSIATMKRSHNWAYAARWLIDNTAEPYHSQATDLLFGEAINLKSPQRKAAVSTLLDIGAISPLGEPIQEAVRGAVLNELREQGEKHGTCLNVDIPGISKKAMDMILFEENPSAVIRLLHEIHPWPQTYRRKGQSQAEFEWNRDSRCCLLAGTHYWPEVLAKAVTRLKTVTTTDRDLTVALLAASGADLVAILQHVFLTTRHQRRGMQLQNLLWELDRRGWRLRFRGRQVEVLRKGQEGPRADVGYWADMLQT